MLSSLEGGFYSVGNGMLSINEWRERYEVSLKGREPKDGEELRAGPLAYVRLKVYGHRQGTGYRRLQQLCGERFMEVFGIFCKLLEISGDQVRDFRGKLLNENDQEATIDDLAFIIGIPGEQVAFALDKLCVSGWVLNDSAALNSTKPNSTQLNLTQHKGTEISGKTRKSNISYDYGSEKFTNITDNDIKKWGTAFPSVSIEQELNSASIWLRDNPTKRKSQVRRFISNWLRRCQEKGGSRTATQSNSTGYQPPPPNIGADGKTAGQRAREQIEDSRRKQENDKTT